MLKAFIHRLIGAQLERPFGYDASYLHAVADASPATFFRFSVLTGLVDRRAAPAEALAAAGLVGTLAEDCGPCTQIGVDMALKGGARPAVIRAILAGDAAAMGEAARLGYRFARASLARDLEEADGADQRAHVPDAQVRDGLRPGLLEGDGGGRGGALRAPAAAGGVSGDPVFEAERLRLQRLAYRMLGEVAEAEDVVQDAWLRWRRADRAGIADPAAWLVRAATRLSIDRLRAQKTRRAAYRGPWLPEPLIEDLAEDPLERAEEVSVAFLLALERLSPLERAVFLLHDVFDADYAAVAETLDRSEAACRQLAARARAHVRDARPRFAVSQEEATRLAMAFMAAARDNDLGRLSELLAEDAVLISDGGGKRAAALRPLVGRDDILALLKGLAWRKNWLSTSKARLVRVNGYLGAILEDEEGPVTVAFQPGAEGKIAAVYLVANPEKLTAVRAPQPSPRDQPSP
jgi:RNA polymerase sigma-70 factor (ECF subfamily)